MNPYGPYGPQWVQPPQQPQVILMQMPGGDSRPPSRPPRSRGGSAPKMMDSRLSFKQMKKLRKKMNEYVKELEEEKKGGEKKEEKKEDKKKTLKDKTFNWIELFGLMCIFGLPVGTGMLFMIKACTLMIKSF